MSEWISVKTRLPEPDEIVFAWCKTAEDSIIKARFIRHDKRTKGYFDSAEFEEYPEILLPGKHITHWQPLPDPPKGS